MLGTASANGMSTRVPLSLPRALAGKDATAQFVAYHSDRALKGWKSQGTYEWDVDAPGGDALEGDFLKMSARYEEEGLFETPTRFIAERFGAITPMRARRWLCGM